MYEKAPRTSRHLEIIIFWHSEHFHYKYLNTIVVFGLFFFFKCFQDMLLKNTLNSHMQEFINDPLDQNWMCRLPIPTESQQIHSTLEKLIIFLRIG